MYSEAGHGMELQCHFLHQASQMGPPLFSNLSNLCIPSSIHLNQLVFIICELILSLLKDHKFPEGSIHLLLSSPGSQWGLIKCLLKWNYPWRTDQHNRSWKRLHPVPLLPTTTNYLLLFVFSSLCLFWNLLCKYSQADKSNNFSFPTILLCLFNRA